MKKIKLLTVKFSIIIFVLVMVGALTERDAHGGRRSIPTIMQLFSPPINPCIDKTGEFDTGCCERIVDCLKVTPICTECINELSLETGFSIETIEAACCEKFPAHPCCLCLTNDDCEDNECCLNTICTKCECVSEDGIPTGSLYCTGEINCVPSCCCYDKPTSTCVPCE